MRSFVQLSDAKTAAQYRSMTFPPYRGLLNFNPAVVDPLANSTLQNEAPAGSALSFGLFNSAVVAPLAIATLENEVPAGLALILTHPGAIEAELLSIFVSPRLRRSGIGLELLQRTLAYCKTHRIQNISASYMSGQDSTQALESILNKTGWTAPQTRMLAVRCSLDSIKSAPWLNRYALPKGYEVLPWAQVTTAEREALRVSNLEKPWIAPDLVPFNYEENYDRFTSVALRVNGAIIGWCLNHVIDGILRFTCSFLRRDLQRLGRIVLLYSDSVSRMSAAGLSVGMWTIPIGHAGMANFARKHMQPYSIFFGETRGVTVHLGATEGLAAQ